MNITMTPQSSTVAVVGLGKLGIPIAAVIADRGFSVIGVDINEDVVEAINQRQSPIYERGVRELLECGRFSATTNLYSAASMADIIIVIVSTPSDESGGFSPEYVADVCHALAEVIRDSDVFRLIVVSSTVMPKTMDRRILPLLETMSGKRAGIDFGLCYSPFFVALGSVIQDFAHPSFALIGENDAISGDLLERFYQCIYDDSVPIVSMNFINAEITKLVLNCFLVGRITYANTIAQMCERISGADADVVMQTIGLDRRIGPALLKGGLAYGGLCFPHDVIALSAFERDLGLDGALPAAFSDINAEMTARLLDIIEEYEPDGCVGILGLSFKPNTDVVEESPGILLAKMLLEANSNVVYVHDPAALDNARNALKKYGKVAFCTDVEQVTYTADIVFIMMAWDCYRGIESALFNCVVVDCWRILDQSKLHPSVKYIALGVGE